MEFQKKFAKNKTKVFVLALVFLAALMLLGQYWLFSAKKKPKATGETVNLSFNPASAIASSGQSFTADIRARPTSNINVRVYSLKVTFDKTKLEVSDIRYNFGAVSAGLGDDNNSLASVNSKEYISLRGEIQTTSGQILLSSGNTNIVRLGFKSLLSPNSSTAISVDGAASSFTKINADQTLAAVPATLATPMTVSSSGTIPTNTPTPSTGVTNTPTPSPSPTTGPSPTPTQVLTPTLTPTQAPNAAKLKLKIQLPDVASATTNIPAADVQVEVKDGITSVGVANVDLVRSGNYFQTASEISFNISQDKTYSVFIKSKISLGKLFNGVNLTQSLLLDCTVASDSNCGELISQRDSKLLLSGDSDGFNTGSGSYNKIDSADLQVLAGQFNTAAPSSGPSADYNLDGQVDISDLDILGRNYGQQGGQ